METSGEKFEEGKAIKQSIILLFYVNMDDFINCFYLITKMKFTVGNIRDPFTGSSIKKFSLKHGLGYLRKTLTEGIPLLGRGPS